VDHYARSSEQEFATDFLTVVDSTSALLSFCNLHTVMCIQKCPVIPVIWECLQN